LATIIIALGTLIEAAKSGSVSRFIGRSRSEDSVCNSPPPNLRHARNGSASASPNSEEAVTESPTDSNPSLDKPDNEHHHHFKHLQQRHQSTNSQQHQSPTNNNNNSNVQHSNPSHKKESLHHHLHMPHVNLNFSALAALKRKRKKFSNSRNESPVLEPPPENATSPPTVSSTSSNIKKTLRKVI
jgi:transient receptor potential cation channel subfamily C